MRIARAALALFSLLIACIPHSAAANQAHSTTRLNDSTIAFDGSAIGTDAFVAMLNADGTAQFYSSFFGGTGFDEGRGIALDAANNVYITGQTLSSSFPHINAFQNALASADGDAFVTKFSAVATVAPTKILYSSFLGGSQSNGGGSGKEFGNGIAVDKKGNVYLAGTTASNAFPTTAGTAKPSSPGVTQFNTDAFVTKIESTFPDTIGVYNPATSQFRLRNSNTPGGIDLTINSGQGGDIPVAGDWNGDGIKDPGVFRPGAGQFFLTDSNIANPSVDHSPIFGTAGDLPVAGDFNSDGKDTVGVFRPSTAQFFLTNQDALNPSVDIAATFGVAEDLPVAGDFDGDGKDTIGVWRPSVATFFLSNNNAAVDITAAFGANGDQPVVGDWDGKP